jgi:hypothetical protein
MVMTRFAIALAFSLVVAAGAARAEDAPSAGCTVAAASFISQQAEGTATIACTGLGEGLGQQLADILTRIVQNRLDPELVMAKLAEVGGGQQEGGPRTVDEAQRQLIIQSLVGKPAGQIAITAHPGAEDSVEFAKAIATSLSMVGWQIEGRQIRRAAPKSLDPVRGIAVVVRDRGAPPPQALQLKAALTAAHIGAALVADASVAPDATLLWVGQRPAFMSPEPAK